MINHKDIFIDSGKKGENPKSPHTYVISACTYNRHDFTPSRYLPIRIIVKLAFILPTSENGERTDANKDV